MEACREKNMELGPLRVRSSRQLSLITLGVEGKRICHPQMPLWHTDYFELKVLEKQPVQRGPFFVPLKAGNKYLM